MDCRIADVLRQTRGKSRNGYTAEIMEKLLGRGARAIYTR